MVGASTFRNADRALRIASLGVALCALHHFSNASLSDPGRNVMRSFMGLTFDPRLARCYELLPSRNLTISDRRWLISFMSPTCPQFNPSVSGAGLSFKSSSIRSSKSLATRWAFSYAAFAVNFGFAISAFPFACGLVPVGCRSSSPRPKCNNRRTISKRSYNKFAGFFTGGAIYG